MSTGVPYGSTDTSYLDAELETPPTFRSSIPVIVQPTAPKRNKHKPLTTEQIIAIVFLFLILGGVILITLALTGVLNTSPSTVQLTPSVVPPSVIPSTAISLF